jgi:hypothetical protein
MIIKGMIPWFFCVSLPLLCLSAFFLPMSAAFRLLPTRHHLMAFASSSTTSTAQSHMVKRYPAFQSNGYVRLISKTCDNLVNKRNRYDRFRDCLRLATSRKQNIQVFSKDDVELMDVAKCAMEIMSSNRRSFNRTWERMSPLIQLILLPCKSNNKMKSIADVGCDHGMLALSLACIAWVNQSRGYDKFLFSKVYGTDLSSQALENGGISSLKQVNFALSKISLLSNDKSLELPIQFRIGDGLSALQPGEADALVIAGMGVHTMLDIVIGTSEATALSLGSEYLFLQPTNSRPQHLIILYDGLQTNLGWELCDEKVAFVGNRWYISSYFRRNDNDCDTIGVYRFPGHYLLDNGIFDSYVKHHLEWLKQDFERAPSLVTEDVRWIKHISSLKDKDEWKGLAAWYNDR